MVTLDQPHCIRRDEAVTNESSDLARFLHFIQSLTLALWNRTAYLSLR